MKVQPRKSEPQGDRDFGQEADHAPEQRGDGASLDHAVVVASAFCGLHHVRHAVKVPLDHPEDAKPGRRRYAGGKVAGNTWVLPEAALGCYIGVPLRQSAAWRPTGQEHANVMMEYVGEIYAYR